MSLAYKLYEKLPSVTFPEMNISCFIIYFTFLYTIFLLDSLREYEVGSTFGSDPRKDASNFPNIPYKTLLVC